VDTGLKATAVVNGLAVGRGLTVAGIGGTSQAATMINKSKQPNTIRFNFTELTSWRCSQTPQLDKQGEESPWG
jgi:hypothetical protein